MSEKMSRAPRPMSTPNTAALPAHVMSNMHLASAMGVQQVPTVLVQSPVATPTNNDPNMASTMPTTYNTPLHYETHHIPIVDFKAGVNAAIATQPAPQQQILHTQVPTNNPYGVSTNPTLPTESTIPSKDYLRLSRQLYNLEKRLDDRPLYTSHPSSYSMRSYGTGDPDLRSDFAPRPRGSTGSGLGSTLRDDRDEVDLRYNHRPDYPSRSRGLSRPGYGSVLKDGGDDVNRRLRNALNSNHEFWH